MGRMLRTALSPRLAGLFALLLALVTAFVLLGLWQWDVAHDNSGATQATAAQRQPVAPVTRVMRNPSQEFPRDGSLRPVRATGRYDGSRQELVAGRELGGQSGYWVLTPLVVDGTSSRLPVVRGFVTNRSQARLPSTGDDPVTVTGALAPGESPEAGAGPPGTIGSINLAILANTWGGTVYNAFIFRTAETPVATVAPVRTFPPPTPGGGGFHLLNAGYAVQWWAFAVFAIYVWVRTLRDEHQLRLTGVPARGADADNRDLSTAEKPAAERPIAESKDPA